MIQYKRYTLFSFFIFLLSLNTHAQNTEYLSELFKAFVEKEDYSGNILVGTYDEEIIFQESIGLADERFDIPVTEDIKFDIASVSKQFTSAIILKYYEQGLIDLKAPIITYLPFYRNDTGSKLTVSDLLTHRSGIPNFTSLPGVWEDSLRNHYKFEELLTKFCSGDLEFEPGTKYQYNNSGYALLAAIIENVSGKSFEKVVNEELLLPLGLKNTGVSSREIIIKDKAYGYVNTQGKKQQANYTFMPNLNGAGSMYSTTKDLLRWTIALHTGKVLKEDTYSLMTNAYSVDKKWVSPYKNGYGYGLGMYNYAKSVRSNDKWNVFFHSGHISGFSSFLISFKDKDTVVVLLSNMGGVSTIAMNELSVGILNELEKNKTVSSGK